jgi:hypothetical protein
VASYGIVLWAMTRAPVAAVAALRETSVIFGALVGAWLLKEGHVRRRLGGAAAVLASVPDTWPQPFRRTAPRIWHALVFQFEANQPWLPDPMIA